MVILLFREFHFLFDSKVGTFASFCLTFTKFDVGISLGLDFTALGATVSVCKSSGLNLNWLHALVDSFSYSYLICIVVD